MITMRLEAVHNLYAQVAEKDRLQDYLKIDQLFKEQFISAADEEGFGPGANIPVEQVLQILKKIKPISIFDEVKGLEEVKKISVCFGIVFCLSVTTIATSYVSSIATPLVPVASIAGGLSGFACFVLWSLVRGESEKIARKIQVIKNRINSFKDAQQEYDGLGKEEQVKKLHTNALKNLQESPEFSQIQRDVLSARIEEMMEKIRAQYAPQPSVSLIEVVSK